MIIKAAGTYTVEDIRKFDSEIPPEWKEDGLEHGLAGVLFGTSTKPLTSENLEHLEAPFGISRLNMLLPKLEPHLTQGEPGAPLGLFIDRSGQGMDRRSGEFITRGVEVFRASDAEIARRKAEAREKMRELVFTVDTLSLGNDQPGERVVEGGNPSPGPWPGYVL